jgi:hypothetical protein
VYLQSRLEDTTITYAIYVVYGFQPANANRRDFICEDYKKEIGVAQRPNYPVVSWWLDLTTT